jgi:hypothetical protein
MNPLVCRPAWGKAEFEKQSVPLLYHELKASEPQQVRPLLNCRRQIFDFAAYHILRHYPEAKEVRHNNH